MSRVLFIAMYMMLRLVGGPRDHVGRVEAYKHGIWGDVCIAPE